MRSSRARSASRRSLQSLSGARSPAPIAGGHPNVVVHRFEHDGDAAGRASRRYASCLDEAVLRERGDLRIVDDEIPVLDPESGGCDLEVERPLRLPDHRRLRGLSGILRVAIVLAELDPPES